MKKIYCPHCNSPMWKNGHQELPKGSGKGYQNYLCKNPDCRYQFTPDYHKKIHKRREKISIPCPKCGRKMYRYKKLKSVYRLRCSGYTDKKNPCCYKINYTITTHKIACTKHLQGKDKPVEKLSILFNPLDISKLKKSYFTVILVLYFVVVIQLPSTKIALILNDIFHIHICDSTITLWRKRFALNVRAFTKTVAFPNVGHVQADETFFYKSFHNVLFEARDPNSKLMIGWNFAHQRDNDQTVIFFNDLKQKAPNLKQIQTDGAHSYEAAAFQTFQLTNIIKQTYAWNRQQNAIERQHGYHKDAIRTFRGLKTDPAFQAFTELAFFYFNFIKSRNDILKEQSITPAKAAGGIFMNFDSPLHAIIHCLTYT